MESLKGGGDSDTTNKAPPKTRLIFLTLLVNQHPIKILIDTGANSTFINEKVLKYMSHLRYIKQQPSSFTLADGIAPFHILGSVDLSVQFGNSITPIKAYIARQLCTDMIIGMDYINLYDLSIDVKRQTISIDHNNQVFTMNMDKDYELRRIPVTLSKSTVILPRSTYYTSVSNPISTICSSFVPVSDFLEHQSLLTRYTFLKFNNYRSHIRFFNSSLSSRFLHKGTCIGFLFCYPTDCDSLVVSDPSYIPLGVTGLSGMTSVSDKFSVNQVAYAKSNGVTGTAVVTSASSDLSSEPVRCSRFSSIDHLRSSEVKGDSINTESSLCNTIRVEESIVMEHIRSLTNKITDPKQQEDVYSLLVRFKQTFDTSKHNIAETPMHHVIKLILYLTRLLHVKLILSRIKKRQCIN